jgi:galactose mutarotase-like enzyme
MSGVHVSTGWQVHGTDAVRLRNRHLSAVVLPGLGAKVWEVLDHRTGRQVLWQHPAVRPERVPFGAAFDDVFAGGWDELFPNDMPEVLAGEPEPDHGEAWSLAWDWTVEDTAPDGSITLRMRTRTPVSSCLLEKSVTLGPDDRHLVVRSSVTSLSRRDLPFLWKQHLALDVTDQARIDMPGRRGLIEDFGTPRAGAAGTEFAWPVVVDGGAEHDMRPTLPADSGACEFYYVTGLDDGWCALTYADGSGVGLAFDRAMYPSCWVFASYGGWRDLQVAVLEPCTGYPVSVNDGIEAGTHRVLRAGETLATSMTLVLYDGLASVTRVAHDGTVEGPAA